jgi:hypothetical protein
VLGGKTFRSFLKSAGSAEERRIDYHFVELFGDISG